MTAESGATLGGADEQAAEVLFPGFATVALQSRPFECLGNHPGRS